MAMAPMSAGDFQAMVATICLCVFFIVVIVLYWHLLRKKPDYRDIIGRAIDIPNHIIDKAKVETHLQNRPLRCEPEAFWDKRHERGFYVEIERKQRHPASIQFAKSGSIPIQVYYQVDVVKNGPMAYRKSVFREEYDSLDSALYQLTSHAKPVQQAPITPPAVVPVEVPVNQMDALQEKIDAIEGELERVRLKKYANRGLVLADVAMLEGWKEYLDLLKERDELMWEDDKKTKALSTLTDNTGTVS